MKKAVFLWMSSAFFLQVSAGENPMLFTKNIGQWDARIYYAADLSVGKILLERSQITFALSDYNPHEKAHNPNMTNDIHTHIFRLKFQGANTESLVPSGIEAAYRNYYIGNDSSKWRSNVPVYKKNTFKNLYAGIDLEVSGDENGFTYEYIIQPNANPHQIRQVYEGIGEVQIENEEIHYTTNIGNITEKNIAAYQIVNGEKRAVKCVLKKSGKNSLFYDFPNGYNRSQMLIIDPTIDFGTYTGSTADNWGYTATYDNNGSMYVGGLVSNLLGGAYPTTAGAFQSTYGGGTGNGSPSSGSGIAYSCDMAITKYTPNGTALIFSTYLGGNDNETPNSLVVNPQGDLIIYGVTYSANYPTSANAYDNSYNGNGDIVVTKFNASGSALIGSTFFGGASPDGTNGPADEFTFGSLKYNYGDQNRGEVNVIPLANSEEVIVVASCTKSTELPDNMSINGLAIQGYNHGGQDGLFFELNNDCSQLYACTYLGGSGDDACYGLSFDYTTGSVVLCGGTKSTDFPTTSNVLHSTYPGGNYDGFITRIPLFGGQFQSTFIGTSGNDQVYFVQTDGAGDVYFVGQTTGAYPVVNAVYSNPNSGQFIACVNTTLDTVRYSTVFGNGNGQPNISPTAFLVDTCKNVYVTGWGARTGVFGSYATDIYNLPLTSDAQQTHTDGTDFYHFVLAKNATGILYGSYFGGNGSIEHVDGGTNRFDKRGIIYEAICAGCLNHNSLTPATPGVWSVTNRSQNCNLFGLKMEFNLGNTEVHVNAAPRTTGCVPLTVNFTSQTFNTTGVFWDFRDGATSTQLNPTHTFTDTGTYNVMLIGKAPNSCNEKDTAYVEVIVRNDSLFADFISNVAVNCTTKTVSLTAPTNSSATRYYWNFGDGTNDSTISVSHTYANAGTYNVSLILVDTTRCSLRDTFSYPVLIKANAEAGFALTNPCAGQVARFSNTSQENNPVGNTFRWFFGDSSSTSAQENPTHVYANSGVYDVTFVVTDTSSCNLHDTLHQNITVYAPPVAAFTTNGDTFKFTAPVLFENESTNSDIYFWNFGDGATSEETSPTHAFDHTVNWQKVCLTASSSTMPCIDSVCHKLFISFTPLIGVPNAFSPNGDGRNDVVRVEGKGIIELDFRIFNRWGEEVYHGTNQAEGWNGIFRGTPQEMEVYTYTVAARMINTEVVNLKGNITLLR